MGSAPVPLRGDPLTSPPLVDLDTHRKNSHKKFENVSHLRDIGISEKNPCLVSIYIHVDAIHLE